MKERIDIKSIRKRDFSTKVVVSDKEFLVETDLSGKPKPTITSRIYQEGQIITIYKQELDDIIDKASIYELMIEHHQLSIEAMKEALNTPQIIPIHNSLLDTIGNIEEAMAGIKKYRPLNTTDNIKKMPAMPPIQCSPDNPVADIEVVPKGPSAHCSADNATGDIREKPEVISAQYSSDTEEASEMTPLLYPLNHIAEYIEEPQTSATPSSSHLSKQSIDEINKTLEATRMNMISEDTVNNIKKAQKKKKSPSDFINVINAALEASRMNKVPEDTANNIEQSQVEVKSPSEYIKEVNMLLAKKNLSTAMNIICEGVDKHPKDPSLLSLHGYLTVKVQKNYRRGITNCKKAIDIIRRKLPSDPAFVYPNFFLNLGRAYLEAGDRKHAVDTFMRVLYVDESNSLIRTEMSKLGARRKPFIAFLSRSNPLNKYAGLVIYRLRRKVA